VPETFWPFESLIHWNGHTVFGAAVRSSRGLKSLGIHHSVGSVLLTLGAGNVAYRKGKNGGMAYGYN